MKHFWLTALLAALVLLAVPVALTSGTAPAGSAPDETAAAVTDDGTIAVVKTDSYTWRIYTFNPAAPAEPEPDTPEPSDDGTWTCSNGHEGNTGKFCPECGESRPAQQLTACPECGYEFPEGTSPKFCPECGAKLSE